MKRRKWNPDWWEKHPEKVLEYNIRRRERRRVDPIVRQKQREWDINNPEKRAEYQRKRLERYHADSEYRAKRLASAREAKERAKLVNAQARLKLIQELGGKCVSCGFSNIKALIIHHKGQKNRKDLINRLFRYEVLEKEKDHLELLCANCHLIVHSESPGRWKKAEELTPK